MAEFTEQELKDAGMSPEKIKEMMSHAKTRIREAGEQITDSFSVLEKIQEWTKGAADRLDSLGSVSGAAATEFGLLAAGIAGARKEAENFAGLDTGRLGSFTESTKNLFAIIRESPGFGAASAAGQQLMGMLKNLGVSNKDMAAAATMSGAALVNFAEKIMIGADNSLRFGSAIMDAAAKGGNFTQLMNGLGDSFGGVGAHLENLGAVTSQFHNIMGAAMKATGTESVDEMNKFVGALLKTPDGMNAMIKGVDMAGSHLDGLTAILRLADGANLSRAQTMEDMHKVESQFGMDTTKSIALMGRIVDVSKDLGAQQGDVRDAILKTTGAFNLFAMKGVDAAKMTQGLTDSVKNWASSLERAGIPAQNALALASKYTTQLKDMSEAQEALVSQQTGGPGGLLGALQFEDLQRTDPAAAAAKVQETIKSMLPSGQMISKADSVKGGEEGASQFILQRKILMDGLAGIKAGSKEEADAMIAAMLAGKAIPSGKTTEQTLAETMETGKAKEGLAYSALKEANITAEIVRLQAGDINLGTLRNTAGGTAATGNDDTGRGINIASQERLQQRREGPTGTSQTTGTQLAIDGVTGLMKDIPMYVTSALASGKRQLTKDSTAVPLPPQGSLPKVAPASKGAPEWLVKDMKARAMDETKGANLAPSMPAHMDTDADSPTFGEMVNEQGQISAGAQVRQSAVAASKTPDAGAGADTRSARTNAPGLGPTTASGPIPVTLAPGSGLSVNITSTCPHCGKDSHQSASAHTNNAASTASNK